MENEVVIHVRAEDDTEATFAAIRAKAKKLGEDLERDLKQSGTKAGRSLADGIEDGLTRGKAAITREADKIGDAVVRQMDSSGNKAGRELADGIKDGLDGQAATIIAEAEVLGEEIEKETKKSGKKAGKGIGEGIDEGLKGAMPGPDFGERLFAYVTKEAKKSGKKIGGGLGEGIADVLDSHPAITAAVLGLGATVAPLLAGVLGAAVVGTGGLLGIAGGFAASVKDPRVKSSLQDLKKQVMMDLESAGSSFAPASIKAIGQVKNAWADLMPTIRSVFNKSADLIEPFLDGLLDGIDGLVSGIEESLDGAGPVMEALGDLFRNFGQDFGEVFADLEDNAGELAVTVDMFSEILGFLLDAITAVIEVSAGWLAQFPALRQDIAVAKDATLDWIDGLDGVKDRIQEVDLRGAEWHDGLGDGTEKIKEQTSALQALSEEMTKQTDPLYNLISAQQDVKDAQEKYNKALDKHGPKSQEARDALLRLGKAAGNVTEAAAKAADSGFNGTLTPAMRQAMRQAGLSERQINALAGALRNAKGAANAWEGTFTQTYITRYKTMGLKSPQPNFQGYASGGITGAATGGMHSGLRMVGEAGPELMQLPPGSHVYSNPDTQSLVAGSGGVRGSNPTNNQERAAKISIGFDPAGANRLVRAIMETLRAEIRAEGGSVQTVLGTFGVG